MELRSGKRVGADAAESHPKYSILKLLRPKKRRKISDQKDEDLILNEAQSLSLPAELNEKPAVPVEISIELPKNDSVDTTAKTSDKSINQTTPIKTSTIVETTTSCPLMLKPFDVSNEWRERLFAYRNSHTPYFLAPPYLKLALAKTG